MLKILVIDSTLRDGSHAVRHQFSARQISNYAKRAERANIPIIVAGHGNGLGASSLHLGTSLCTDRQILYAVKKELKKTRLGAFAIPGFATLDDINMAISEGVDVMFVASHCTEATVTKQYIEYCVKKGLTVYGVLMMSHMLSTHKIEDIGQQWDQINLMMAYGAKGVFLMDSAGAYMPNDALNKFINFEKFNTGFHPHNNLGLAVANGLKAISAGAAMIDGTSRGLGAGAGNLPLEIIVPLLHKLGYKTGINEEKLFECADYIASQFPPQIVDSVSIVSGLSGVFSGFKPHVLKAAKEFKVSPYAIFRELGKRKTVAGQEDQVLEVARTLAKKS